MLRTKVQARLFLWWIQKNRAQTTNIQDGQANPLNHRKSEMSDLFDVSGSRGILAAHQPLVVPMLLRLSQFHLNSYVVLVLSKQKGCTLVFKTDPLQNVEVSSTFDSIAVIQSFIQREIEEQLREMFREDLPGIIHRLSQRWVAGRTRVEAPYLKPHPPPPVPTRPKKRSSPPVWRPRGSSLASSTTRREPDIIPTSSIVPVPGTGLQPGLHPHLASMRPLSSPSRSFSDIPPSSIVPTSIGARSPKPVKRGAKTPVSSDFPINPQSSLPDIENFDPTYGLRPEGMPMRSGYSGLGKLFEASRGLHELSEEDSRVGFRSELEEESAYDVVEWADGLDPNAEHYHGVGDDVDEDYPHPMSSQRRSTEGEEEMETIPAVGGGFITRPRVYHSRSSIKSPFAPPQVSEPRSTDRRSSLKGRENVTKAPSDGGVSGLSYSRKMPRGMTLLHRDRGMTMEIDGRMTGAYNPYFGDVYRDPAQQRRDYEEVADGESEAVGMDDPVEDSWHGTDSASRSIPRPIGQPGQSGRRPSTSSDHHRSVSRSPLTNDPFQYGSPSNQHLHNSSDEADRDPMAGFGTDRRRAHGRDHPGGIVLRNQSVTHLSALSKSNQTLSPFTRSFSHFTVRSGPPKPLISSTTPFLSSSAHKGPRKATRKRIHRWNGAASSGRAGDPRENSPGAEPRGVVSDERRRGRRGDAPAADHLSQSPPPPSEFSDDDVAHYFRTRRPSEVASPGKRDKRLFSPAVSLQRQRTTSHSSHLSRQQHPGLAP